MGERDQDPPPRSGALERLFLRVAGCASLTLGLFGVVLPLVPATPFILLAAGCFAATWPAMHQHLAESRLFGPMFRDVSHGAHAARRSACASRSLPLPAARI